MQTSITSRRHFICADGTCYDDRRDAARHQATLNLEGWLSDFTDPEAAAAVVQEIVGDVERFRARIAPILFRRRGPRIVKEDAEEDGRVPQGIFEKPTAGRGRARKAA